MSVTEIEPEFARAYGNDCVGCLNHKKDVMLSFSTNGAFTDIFLTNARAAELHKELGERLASNQALLRRFSQGAEGGVIGR